MPCPVQPQPHRQPTGTVYTLSPYRSFLQPPGIIPYRPFLQAVLVLGAKRLSKGLCI